MTLKLIGLVLALLLAGQARDYEVRLSRPTTAGSKYRLTATGSESAKSRLTSGDKVLKATDEGFAIELVADALVLEVDARGRATRKSFTVVSSKITRGGATNALLPAGAVVVALAQGGDVVFQVDGKPADRGLANVLSSVLSVYTGHQEDDELLGTTGARRKPGESWGVNTDAALAMLKELGAEAKKEDLKGSTTFEKVAEGDLFVSSWLSADNVLFPLPEGFKAESGSFRVDTSARLPYAKSDGSKDETQKARMETTGRRAPTANSPELKISVTYESVSTYQVRDLK